MNIRGNSAKLIKTPRFKSTANKLKKYIKKNFDAEIIYKEFVSAICPEEEMEWLNTLGEIEII